MPATALTGANKGIGRAIAAQLAEAGYVVYLGSRDAERGRHAAEELATDQRDVRFLAVDVTDPASVDAAAAILGEEFGHLDVLVNNAGIFVQGRPTAPTGHCGARCPFGLCAGGRAVAEPEPRRQRGRTALIEDLQR